jgi:hypothetical protein
MHVGGQKTKNIFDTEFQIVGAKKVQSLLDTYCCIMRALGKSGLHKNPFAIIFCLIDLCEQE